jgi:hypothetical protein
VADRQRTLPSARWPWALALATLVAGPCAAQLTVGSALSAQQSIAPAFGPPLPAILPNVDQTEISGAISETYSSNVTGVSAAYSPLRGLKPADLITNPYIAGVVSRPLGRDTFFIQGAFGYVDYARNPVLNRSNIEVQGGASAPFGLCQSSLTGAYTRGQADLEELALAQLGPGAVTHVSDTVQDGNIGFTASCGHTVGLAPTVSVSEALVNNSVQQLGDLNARVFSASGGLAYRSASHGVLSALGQYSRTDYPDRFVATPTGLKTQGLETFGGGISYVSFPFTRLQGTASIDYQILQPVSATGQNFYGLTYDFALAYLITPNFSTSLGVSRQTAPSNSPYALFVVREVYDVQVNYSLGSQTVISAGVARRHYVYDDLVIPQIADATVITDSRIFATGERRIGRRLSVSVTLAYRQRDANFPGLSYPDFMAGISARASFQ